MSTFSAVVNGQLIPVAPSNAVVAPPAPQPVISNGAYASNLPGMSILGGATNIPVPQASIPTNSSPTTSTVSTSAAQNGGVPTLGGLTGNVWNLPFWKNPLALTIIMLVAAYLILRYIHWAH
jgi:hypothetical protein